MNRRLIPLSFAALSITACTVASAQVYNAATGFSASANPTGVWSYGLRPGAAGTFAPLTRAVVIDAIDFWDRDLAFPDTYPKIGHNGTGQTQFWGGPEGPIAAGELVMHPGPLPAVLRFTAPSANRYRAIVQARATPTCATATGVSVWAAGAQLDAGSLGGIGSQWFSAPSVFREAGQTIDLVVDNGGNGINCDHVAVSLVVAPIACGPADIGGAGGVAPSDGRLDNNDFVVFIDWFFAGDTRADRGRTGGVAGSDGAFDNNDFIVFIDQFFAGC
ncbi:MAG: GC-type dockerin domain-anchored protein [Phycisphaerales bacterium]|nr:GC-type dockerin domain-anchored protein [Phycisphaerales bacterium]